ncbi:MAG: surface-adhesin E family protein [Nostoc sp.]|uniref:surface-adhesin E family protein n=1 Tax=Nostoc sp. TaxID=1180 RepID=UPI002FF693ED
MKRILGLAIASLIAFPSTALAADWVLVSEAADGTRIFVDNESYERRGAIAWYWTMLETVQADETGVIFRKAFQSTDCRNRNYRIRQLISYNNKGEVIFSKNNGDNGSLYQFVPGTIAENIFKAVCSR